jgi:hypothetical protein
MTKWYRASFLLAVILLTAASCKQLYTTSLGSSLARDGISIPKSTSISELIDISNSRAGSSSAASKEILDVLAGKDAADLTALSIDDKASILNIATTAAVDMATLTDLAKSAGDSADTDALIEAAIDSFDTSVNITAIEVILADPDTLMYAPAESIVFASAVLVADLADEIGSTEIMDILDGTGDESVLTDEQRARVDLVLMARDALNVRPAEDLENVTVGDFDITDFLGGTPG